MTLMIRQIAPSATVTEHLGVEALARVLPPATIAGVLADCGATEQRARKLPAAIGAKV